MKTVLKQVKNIKAAHKTPKGNVFFIFRYCLNLKTIERLKNDIINIVLGVTLRN